MFELVQDEDTGRVVLILPPANDNEDAMTLNGDPDYE